jgi:hypothetical protein
VAASFATNEHDEQDAQAGKVPPGGGKAADAKRQKIIVAATIVGVIIAFITLRKSSSSTAAASGTVPVPPPASSAGFVASSGASPGQGSDIGSYLQNLTQQQAAGTAAQTASLSSYLDNLSKQIQDSNSSLQSSLAPVLQSALPPALASTPPPAPAPAAPAPYVGSFDTANTNVIRNNSTGEIFQVQQSGMLHLNGAQYAALGHPNPTAQWNGPAAAADWTNYAKTGA